AYATALLAAAAMVGFLFLPGTSLTSSTPPSIALRPDRQILPDGSSAELNSGAQFALEFTPERRVVRLLRGEALFDVVKDPSRPFIVAAGQIKVQAVGTMFTVRHSVDEVAVLVTQGQVAVDRMPSPANDVTTGAFTAM